MATEARSRSNWRDERGYAPLVDADRSLFAWEWLRRDPEYRDAAERAARGQGDRRGQVAAAAKFGLIAFEPPHLAVPDARPLWRKEAHPPVLAAAPVAGAPRDSFVLDRLRSFATLVAAGRSEHLLLSDGLRAIRLDGPPGTFDDGPVCLRYRLEGLATARPLVLTLRRFLALCRTGHFARSLHPGEPRSRRWILMLRTFDALADGADQREIARVLLSGDAAEPRWRSRMPSMRSRAQRLVRSARGFAAGGYRALLLERAVPHSIA